MYLYCMKKKLKIAISLNIIVEVPATNEAEAIEKATMLAKKIEAGATVPFTTAMEYVLEPADFKKFNGISDLKFKFLDTVRK